MYFWNDKKLIRARGAVHHKYETALNTEPGARSSVNLELLFFQKAPFNNSMH